MVQDDFLVELENSVFHPRVLIVQLISNDRVYYFSGWNKEGRPLMRSKRKYAKKHFSHKSAMRSLNWIGKMRRHFKEHSPGDELKIFETSGYYPRTEDI